MRIITTVSDLDFLSSTSYPPSLRKILSDEFCLLAASYDPARHPDQVDLTHHGPIVLLEAGDNPCNLSILGLDPKAGGLLGAIAESVERISLDKGTTIFRVIILLNNDFALTLFVPSGCFDQAVEDWLANESELN